MLKRKTLIRGALLVILLSVVLPTTLCMGAGNALIKNVRTALKNYGLRIVIDLTSRTEYKIYKQGKSIIIEVNSTTRRKIRKKRFPPNKVATYYSVKGSGEKTTIEIGLKSDKMEFKAFTLDEPFRIVVDILYPKAHYEEYKEGPKAEGLNITLMEKDIAINTVFGYQDFYFDISPTWKLLPESFINLFISHSQITRPKISNITVYLNGLPIYTIPLDDSNLWRASIKIPMPVSYLKKGVNVIELKSFMRTTEEKCMDIDNPGNWLRIHKESYVHLNYLPKEELSIKDFPSPYFEENVSHRELTAFVLPDKWSPKEIEAVSVMALDWAQRGRFKKFSPDIFFMRELNSDIRSKYNLIYIGKASAFPASLLSTFGVDQKDLKDKYAISSFINSSGKGRLLITSDTEKGVLRGTLALLSKEVRKQIEGNKVILPINTPLPKKKKLPELGTDIYFTDLMVGDIIFIGTYSHTDSISFRIPLHWAIKGNPMVVLHFKHSPALDRKKSALTVLINDVPAKSVELSSKNITDGRLVIPIPYDATKGNYINVGFKAYLDINVPDCNHNYSEAAWLVIEKSSYLHLPHDIKAMKPLLENLPFAMVGERIILYLGKNINSDALTTLLNCLISWQKKVYYPLEVSTSYLSNFKVEKFKKSLYHAIILAPANEVKKQGIELLTNKIPVVPDFAEDAMLWQLSVYGGKRLALIITWLKNTPSQTPLYTKAVLKWKLKGDLCFLSSKGEEVPFYLKTPKPPEREKPKKSLWEQVWFKLRYSRTLVGIFALAFLGIVAITAFMIIKNVKRR